MAQEKFSITNNVIIGVFILLDDDPKYKNEGIRVIKDDKKILLKYMILPFPNLYLQP